VNSLAAAAPPRSAASARADVARRHALAELTSDPRPATQLQIGAVIVNAVAVVVEEVAFFLARKLRDAEARTAAAGRRASTPSDAAGRQHVLIDAIVAVVVDAVAQLLCTRINGLVFVVAVAVAEPKSARRAAALDGRL